MNLIALPSSQGLYTYRFFPLAKFLHFNLKFNSSYNNLTISILPCIPYKHIFIVAGGADWWLSFFWLDLTKVCEFDNQPWLVVFDTLFNVVLTFRSFVESLGTL